MSPEERAFIERLLGEWLSRHGICRAAGISMKTNHVERLNGTVRQRVSRLVQPTLSLLKDLANHIDAIRYFLCQ